ncbi:MAG: class A beta-lactamase-related serine hydrolase, partial [Actinomycetota bacterium]|nr:class A beta-lactamase-related serine hydrolase [Actinomycetota bacterium]
KIDGRSLLLGALVRRRRRRQRLGVLVLLLVFLAGAAYVTSGALGSEWGVSRLYKEEPSPSGEAVPVPEQPDTSPEAAAYRAIASELSGMDPESVQGVHRSTLDPSWASVRIATPEEGIYVFFLQRGDDNSWKPRESIRADEPEHPEYEKVVLEEVPKDLIEAIYPQKLASDDSGLSEKAVASELLTEAVEPGSLPSVEAAEVSPPDPVTDGVPESERKRVEEGLEKVQQEIEEYEGVAGVYVRDLEGGYGYGVRPDEVFFSASVIKVPIMVAVFRKIDEGELSLHDRVVTKPEDWAAGAGWLQWESAGVDHTVEDYLLVMMTQSDNVATNLLTRLVGGPEYVNKVSKSMGANNTVLYQKVTSERAAVLSLDNRTTPRDMVTMLEQIYTGEAASPESSLEMIDIMRQNNLESWLKEGLPEDTEAANKAGWLYRVYNEVAIVWHEDRPYVVAILTKRGPEDPQEAKPTNKGISKAVWQTQDDS